MGGRNLEGAAGSSAQMRGWAAPDEWPPCSQRGDSSGGHWVRALETVKGRKCLGLWEVDLTRRVGRKDDQGSCQVLLLLGAHCGPWQAQNATGGVPEVGQGWQKGQKQK